MATKKGRNVPYEIRREVCDEGRKHYKSVGKIVSISEDFHTDNFPHKGELNIFFEGSSNYVTSYFTYRYGVSGGKEFIVTRDWND